MTSSPGDDEWEAVMCACMATNSPLHQAALTPRSGSPALMDLGGFRKPTEDEYEGERTGEW